MHPRIAHHAGKPATERTRLRRVRPTRSTPSMATMVRRAAAEAAARHGRPDRGRAPSTASAP